MAGWFSKKAKASEPKPLAPARQSADAILKAAAARDAAASVAPGATLPRKLGFAASQDGVECLREGWSLPESWGVWSDGKTARLSLPLQGIDIGHPLTLSFACWAFVAAETPQQHVTVSVADQQVAVWSWALETGGDDGQPRVATVPVALLGRKVRLVIDLAISNPTSPVSLGHNADARLLGLGLIGVSY